MVETNQQNTQKHKKRKETFERGSEKGFEDVNFLAQRQKSTSINFLGVSILS